MPPKNRSASVKRAELDALLNEEHMPRPIDFDKRSNEVPVDEERIPIFTINGVDYSIPRRPQMGLGLKFSRDRRSYGSDVAVVNLLTSMIGEEGFEALINYDGMTVEDLETITEICSRAAMGKLEAQRAK
jgi:hypothetical protein